MKRALAGIAIVIAALVAGVPVAAPASAFPQGGPPMITEHLTIGAYEMVSENPGCIAHLPAVSGDGCRYWIAPLHLPDGAIVTRMDIIYEDTSPTGNAVIGLADAPLDGSFDGDAGLRFDSPDEGTPGFAHATVQGEAQIDNSALHYHLEATLDNADTRFYSAVITYRVPPTGITGPLSADVVAQDTDPTQHLFLGPSQMISKNDGCPVAGSAPSITGANGCVSWLAPIHLPDGAVIQQLDMTSKVENIEVTMAIQQSPLDGSDNSALPDFYFQSAPNAGLSTNTLTGDATVHNLAHHYHFVVVLPDENETFYGAVITYSLPSAPVNGDINCDGQITLGDGIGIARHLVGLAVSQEPDCPIVGGPGLAPASASPQGLSTTQHLVINSEEVLSRNNGCRGTSFAGGVTGEDGCTDWLAQIDLPDGSVITGMDIYYVDSAPGQTQVQAAIAFGDSQGNQQFTNDFQVYSSDSPVVATASTTGTQQVDNLQDDYWLQVHLFDAGTRFISALITYTAPAAAYLTNGDINCDGLITLGDSIGIARHLVGLPVDQQPFCRQIGA